MYFGHYPREGSGKCRVRRDGSHEGNNWKYRFLPRYGSLTYFIVPTAGRRESLTQSLQDHMDVHLVVCILPINVGT